MSEKMKLDLSRPMEAMVVGKWSSVITAIRKAGDIKLDIIGVIGSCFCNEYGEHDGVQWVRNVPAEPTPVEGEKMQPSEQAGPSEAEMEAELFKLHGTVTRGECGWWCEWTDDEGERPIGEARETYLAALLDFWRQIHPTPVDESLAKDEATAREMFHLSNNGHNIVFRFTSENGVPRDFECDCVDRERVAEIVQETIASALQSARQEEREKAKTAK